MRRLAVCLLLNTLHLISLLPPSRRVPPLPSLLFLARQFSSSCLALISADNFQYLNVAILEKIRTTVNPTDVAIVVDRVLEDREVGSFCLSLFFKGGLRAGCFR